MKNSEVELELTFLAREIPKEISGVTPEEMFDIYIPSTAEHPQLRIRKRGRNYVITKKKPVNNDASEQIEISIPLTEEEYFTLSKLDGKRVVKNRYKTTISGYEAEVDLFKESLEGLILIDFEFTTPEEKVAFKMPDCCLADVTQEDFIAGGILAGKSYSDIETRLKLFSYKKL